MAEASLSLLNLVLPEAPVAAEVVRLRLSAVMAIEEVQAADHGHGGRMSCRHGDGPAWTRAYRTPERDEHLLSLEPIERGQFGMVLEASKLTDAEQKAVDRAPWMVQVATRLDARSPLAAFGRQVRFALTAFPEAIAVHDANAVRFVPISRARAIASWNTAPPVDDLYLGQGVFSPEEHGRRWWFHTHGLQRAGLPDVEVLRVPHSLLDAASSLTRAFVRAHLGRSVPLTGEAPDLFGGHALAWMPAMQAAASLGRRFPGNLLDRGHGHGHDGRRIVLIEAGRQGRSWRPPIDLLRAFDQGEAVVRLPEQETERAARLARERWSVFTDLFAKHASEPGWEFVVCVPTAVPGGATEALWWRVDEVGGERVRAMLLDEPATAPEGARGAPSRGDVGWHAVSDLCDWTIDAPDFRVDPATVRVPA